MRSSTHQPERAAQDGQVLILVAIASAILLAFAALAVDAGLALAERRGAQNAADAATMAVAQAMVNGETSEQVLRDMARSYAQSNGYDIADPATDVQFPDESTVEVDVVVDVPRFFLGAFYDGDWRVGAEAEATVTQVEEPFALIALGEDPNCGNDTGIRFSGGVEGSVLDGSVGSNSCIRVDGNSGDFAVDGNVEALHGINDSGNVIDVTEGHRKGERGLPIDDPFDHWDSPTCTSDGEVSDDPHYDGPGNGHILTPGTYTDFPSGGQDRQLSLLPGIYCIEDRVTVGNSTFVQSVDASYEDDGQVGDGGGVLLYVTGNNGEIRFNGQGSMEIRSIGYLDPSFTGCTNACEENAAIWISESTCSDFDQSGGSESQTRGIIYAPCSDVELGGNPGTNVLEGMIVADHIRIHGNAEMNLVANQDPVEASPQVFLIR